MQNIIVGRQFVRPNSCMLGAHTGNKGMGKAIGEHLTFDMGVSQEREEYLTD